MKKFRFTADITFLAEDIDNAFELLAEHFRALADNREEDENKRLEQTGEMHINPVD